MQEFLNPITILNNLELREDMAAVDLGAGSGGWVIPLAKRLKYGKVYAVDILEEPLSALKGRANIERLANILTVRANVESESGIRELNEKSADLILMTNLLFQLEKKERVFNEAKRILKSGGNVLIVDWKAGSPLGPRTGIVSIEEVKKLAKKSGFKFEKEFPAGTYHYALVFSNS
ncbi:MAG: class I SAM-dependent methyltransferase [Candidatus Parcubacteria bacterium]|nr:class I SAM-dependent methyltransferase [Candidatus Parcubacteria bacterium]